MTNDNNTKIFELINDIDNQKQALQGFGSSFLIENEQENRAMHLILDHQVNNLTDFSKRLFTLFNKNDKQE